MQIILKSLCIIDGSFSIQEKYVLIAFQREINLQGIAEAFVLRDDVAFYELALVLSVTKIETSSGVQKRRRGATDQPKPRETNRCVWFRLYQPEMNSPVP